MKSGGILFIVMDGHDIRHNVLPAVVCNDGTDGIVRLRQTIRRVRKALHRFVKPHAADPPAFIKGHPHHNRGMVVLLPHDFRPFGKKAFLHVVVERVRRRHFAPDIQPHSVRTGEEIFAFDLLMHPEPVKPHSLDVGKILFDRLIGGRRHARFRPIPLIEHQLLIDGCAVQSQRAALPAELTETEVGTDNVLCRAAMEERRLHVIQSGIVRRPMTDLKFLVRTFKTDTDVNMARLCRNAHAGALRPFPRDDQFDGKPVRKIVKEELRMKFLSDDVGRPFDAPDAVLPRKFQPYALPDARGRNIPAAVISVQPTLFAARVFQTVPVLRLDDDQVFPRMQNCGNLKIKSGIRTVMPPDERSVHPYLCRVVHALKTQARRPCKRFLRNMHLPSIPDISGSAFTPDAACGALAGVRNKDRLLRGKPSAPAERLAFVLFVRAVVPFPVQKHKIVTPHLRNGMPLFFHSSSPFAPSL